MTQAPPDSVIIIEDFDSASATRRRTSSATGAPSNAAELSLPEPLTLAGLLNVLDGVVSLHGKLLFLTTNVVEQLDEALIRPGRVDHIHEIKPLGDAEIRSYIQLVFPEVKMPTRRFAPITGAELQALYLAHRLNPSSFLAALAPTSMFVGGAIGPKEPLPGDMATIQQHSMWMQHQDTQCGQDAASGRLENAI